MKIYSIPFAAALATISQHSGAIPPPPPLSASQLANSDVLAYEIVKELTTEVGPRQGGTEAEQRARDWAVKKLTALGFANVREEKFDMPTWVRGQETASIIAPFAMDLSVTALGNSGATPASGVEGEISYFESYDAFVDATKNVDEGGANVFIKDKIVFIDHKMSRTQDGSSYGYFGRARFNGPNLAAKYGAKGILVRSIGSADHDDPHTGNTNFEAGVAPIPAAAVSNKDANALVHQIIDTQQPPFRNCTPNGGCKPDSIKARMLLTPKNLGMQKSGNVIAEVPGYASQLPPIVIACHLDSWDLGTGAIDDASGCGIITAAASYIKRRGSARTIRILWAGAEEVGIWGGKSYAEKHGETPHALAMESDFGADRVWAVDFNLNENAKPLQDRIARRLALLGIVPRKDKATGGADVGPIIAKQGLAVIDLQQDGTRYFDLHHNAGDRLDKVDPVQLQQNVKAWTIVLEEVSKYEGELKPEMKP